jgi:hypothetical protein
MTGKEPAGGGPLCAAGSKMLILKRLILKRLILQRMLMQTRNSGTAADQRSRGARPGAAREWTTSILPTGGHCNR